MFNCQFFHNFNFLSGDILSPKVIIDKKIIVEGAKSFGTELSGSTPKGNRSESLFFCVDKADWFGNRRLCLSVQFGGESATKLMSFASSVTERTCEFWVKV